MSNQYGEPPGKEYWHPRPVATKGPEIPPDGNAPHRSESSTGVIVARATHRLGHPIATFILGVVAVVLLGVAVLAVTGNGALRYPPPQVARCAPSGSRVLGPPGARFTIEFPRRAALLALPRECQYLSVGGPGPHFGVEAMVGPDNYSSIAEIMGSRAVIRNVSRLGPRAVEGFVCNKQVGGCFGLLQASWGNAHWQVMMSGRASPSEIMTFFQSFQPLVGH